jgi:transposase InsO family protein
VRCLCLSSSAEGRLTRPASLFDKQKGARGSQDVSIVSIKYTERLAEAGIEPSVGTIGDSYDNPHAETVIDLFKTDVIR